MASLSEHKVSCAVVRVIDELVGLFEKWNEKAADPDRGSFTGFKTCWRSHATSIIKFSRVHMAALETGDEITDVDAKRRSVNWETSDEAEQELAALYTGAIRLLDSQKPLFTRAAGLFIVTCLYHSLPSKLVRAAPWRPTCKACESKCHNLHRHKNA